MNPQPHVNNRILIIDDNEDIHRDFRRILTPSDASATQSRLDDLEATLLGTASPPPALPCFELTSAFQGAEALERVHQALREGRPYALAFIDMRMPPGWDGLETLSRLWQEDPGLLAVLCSAYSDYSWETLHARFGKTDQLLILKKPFDPVEVRQMTWALVERWNRGPTSSGKEQEPRGGELTLEVLLGLLPDALLRVAADGTCLDFRPPRLASRSTWPSFPPGRKLNEVLPEDAARGMLSRIQQAMRDGTLQLFEHAQPVAGQSRSFESRIAALNATEALVLVRDLTGR